jgi:hypothetical protein
MCEGYIELNRTFIDFQENQEREESALQSYVAERYGDGPLNWTKLLESRYVVLLGEPGSGKTWEMEAQVELLRQQGQYAFFIPIERLINKTIDNILLLQEKEIYRDWQKKPAKATFFLDAVDEAKLIKLNAIRDVLANFTQGIGLPALPRSKVVISCRVSEWQGDTDCDELCRYFNISSDNSKDKNVLRIVRLAPLSDKQIHSFVSSRLPKPDKFIQALYQSQAWEFAGRPQDITDLINYWQRFGQLGTLRQLIEFNITEKLKEPHPERPNPLSYEKAKDGVERLAAATVFCKRFTFAIDENIDLSEAISPSLVLSQWHKEEIDSILNRALFDSAIYGRVRFHHRRTSEYLAASWLQSCLINGCDYSQDVEPHLFIKCYEQTVIPPSLAPIAAWLAVIDNKIWNQRLKEKLLGEHPEILIKYGDPQSLSIDDRRLLLQKIVKKYSSNTKVYFYSIGDYFDYAKQLHFLSAPELAEDIQKYIRDKTLADGIKEFFIELARHGRLTECIDAVLGVLESSNAQDHLTWIAVLTIRDAGSLAHRQQLARIAIHYPSISGRLCDALCGALYPNAIDVDNLITLLERTEQPHKVSTLLQRNFEGYFKKDLSQDHLKRLLAGLNRLMNQLPLLKSNNKTVPISERYAWLGQILALIVKRLLQYQQLGEELVAKAAKALIMLDSYNKYQEPWNEKVSLVQELQYHQTILQAYVWQRVKLLQAKQSNKRLSWYDIFHHYSVAKRETVIKKVDLKWLLEDVATIESEANRMVALQLAIDLWNDSGRPRQYIKQFRQALQKQPSLQQFFHKQVENWFIWKLKPYWYFYRSLKYYEWKYKVSHPLNWFLKNWFQEKKRYWRNWFWLLRHLKDIREGKWWALCFLIAYCQDFLAINKKRELSNWQAIIPLYGKHIEQAAQQGLKSFWRIYNPLSWDIDKLDKAHMIHILPYDIQLNCKAHMIDIGLTGLTIAITEGLKFSDLSESEAKIAAAYAANEINGFPDWLSKLAAIHPQAVRQVLSQYIQWQWQSFNATYSFRSILLDLWCSPLELQKLVIEEIWQYLLANDPLHSNMLRVALMLLLKCPGIFEQKLSNLAAKRINTLSITERPFLIWLMAWFYLDGKEAIKFLEDLLDKIDNPNAFMEQFCADSNQINSLPHQGYVLVKMPLDWQATVLEQLIILVCQYIRFDQDIHHEGTYTPNNRDYAQGFRDSLFSALAQSSDREAYPVLNKLADNPLLVNERDWILKLATERVQQEAEKRTSWEPNDIADFSKECESTPHSSYSLFKLALKRLASIKDEVENHDFSIRGIIRPEDDECELRKFLGKRLEELSQSRYEVVQEAEVDAGKKTDLRLTREDLGPVTIEIKLSHKRRYTELKKALTEQLVGLYLKAYRSQYGILLLGHISEKATWKDQKRNLTFNFNELINDLKKEAKNILDTRMDIKGLEVIGLNFSSPPTKKQQSQKQRSQKLKK